MERSEETILVEALEKPAEQRAEYLEKACEGDAALRQSVESLLEAYSQGEFLESPAAEFGVTNEQSLAEQPGTQIGPYKLLEQIGEGGMGFVYMAEQERPVKRRVALKIIKPGMDTRQVIARFEAERQALAMMDHPHIAKVLDAGATESGRPYFVMELVDGLPVTQFCDELHLTPKERLELFIPICLAVQHAHQKGIIHRDIKPSNILVAMYDNKAVPKIIDFGVAKATSQTLTEKTMFTQHGQVVGTLEYMSPEQAQRNQLDIDTRSDIYSLGVVLYELLTGETPFDRQRLRSAAFDEMLRIVREEEPSKPSTKVSSSQSLPSIAANRRIDPAKLGSLIRGELDWIVMRAMEKDRRRRYETASQFAEDVQRYLNDEAVVACPPSPAYRIKKLVRRNRTVITTIAIVSLVLVGGIIGTAWQAAVAKADRNRADAQRQRATAAEQLAQRNLQGALDAVDQMLFRVGDETLENLPHLEEVRYELLEDAVQLYDRLLEDDASDPQLRVQTAATERSKARVLLLLGRLDEAMEPVNRSISLLRKAIVEAPENQKLNLELAQSLLVAGAITGELEPLEQAVAHLDKVTALELIDRNEVIAFATTLNRCGLKFEDLGKQERAEKVLAQAEQLFEKLDSRWHSDYQFRVAYAQHLINFAGLHGRHGDWKAKESKLDRAIELCQSPDIQSKRAEQGLMLATAFLNRGMARFQQQAAPTLSREEDARISLAESDDDLQRAAELFRELVRDFPSVPKYRELLASALSNRMWLIRDDPELATKLSTESLQIMDKLVTDFPAIQDYHRSFAAALCNEANRLRITGGDLERAKKLATQAIAQTSYCLAEQPEDPTSMQYRANSFAVLAEVLIARGEDQTKVVDACVSGLEMTDRLKQKYPENEFVLFVDRSLREMKQAAEQALDQGQTMKK